MDKRSKHLVLVGLEKGRVFLQKRKKRKKVDDVLEHRIRLLYLIDNMCKNNSKGVGNCFISFYRHECAFILLL